MKRQRGRGRNNNNNRNNNHNRAMDSNGPEVKVRGTASTIYEKYTTLARDAQSSGNRVNARHAGKQMMMSRTVMAASPAAIILVGIIKMIWTSLILKNLRQKNLQ